MGHRLCVRPWRGYTLSNWCPSSLASQEEYEGPRSLHAGALRAEEVAPGGDDTVLTRWRRRAFARQVRGQANTAGGGSCACKAVEVQAGPVLEVSRASSHPFMLWLGVRGSFLCDPGE